MLENTSPAVAIMCPFFLPIHPNMTPISDSIAPNQKKNLVSKPKNSDITAITNDAIPM